VLVLTSDLGHNLVADTAIDDVEIVIPD